MVLVYKFILVQVICRIKYRVTKSGNIVNPADLTLKNKILVYDKNSILGFEIVEKWCKSRNNVEEE